jgi:hypothetical protein
MIELQNGNALAHFYRATPGSKVVVGPNASFKKILEEPLSEVVTFLKNSELSGSDMPAVNGDSNTAGYDSVAKSADTDHGPADGYDSVATSVESDDGPAAGYDSVATSVESDDGPADGYDSVATSVESDDGPADGYDSVATSVESGDGSADGLDSVATSVESGDTSVSDGLLEWGLPL